MGIPDQVLELLQTVIEQTKTLKHVLILFLLSLIMSSTFIVCFVLVFLYLERDRIFDIVSQPKALPDRIDEDDKEKIKVFYNTQNFPIDSVHVVWYNQSQRKIQTVYSYPKEPDGFDSARQFSMDSDIHASHFNLECVTRVINNVKTKPFLRSSCPIYHHLPLGVEGYVLVLLEPSNQPMTIDERLDRNVLLHHNITELSRTIGEVQ